MTTSSAASGAAMSSGSRSRDKLRVFGFPEDASHAKHHDPVVRGAHPAAEARADASHHRGDGGDRQDHRRPRAHRLSGRREGELGLQRQARERLRRRRPPPGGARLPVDRLAGGEERDALLDAVRHSGFHQTRRRPREGLTVHVEGAEVDRHEEPAASSTQTASGVTVWGRSFPRRTGARPRDRAAGSPRRGRRPPSGRSRRRASMSHLPGQALFVHGARTLWHRSSSGRASAPRGPADGGLTAGGETATREPMSNEHWVRVAATGEISPGEGRVVETGGRALAVFNVEGTYYAIDSTCSHRAGPLGDRELEGTVVVCPWHAWRWDVTSGANVNNPAVRVACFPARVQDGAVFVQLGAGAGARRAVTIGGILAAFSIHPPARRCRMHRFITAALIGVAALAFAGAAEAFQCPKLVGQINATAGNRFDAAASDARIKAAEADRLHKEGKHAEAEKAAEEGLERLGIKA